MVGIFLPHKSINLFKFLVTIISCFAFFFSSDILIKKKTLHSANSVYTKSSQDPITNNTSNEQLIS